MIVSPYFFRAVLDVRCHQITSSMKIAAAEAIARVAREDVSDQMIEAYGTNDLKFGRSYIIPKALDDRLLVEIAAAIADVACHEGLGDTCPENIEVYKEQLYQRVLKKRSKVRKRLDKEEEQIHEV